MLGATRSGQLLLRALRSSSTTSLLPSTSIAPTRWSRLASISPLSSLPTRSYHTTLPRRSYAQAQEDETEYSSPAPPPPTSSQAIGPVTRFSELAERGLVNENIVKTLTTSMRIDTMTDVQCKTINQTLNGIDTLAQARTGTGKTLAFLIPVIQKILQRDPELAQRGGRRGRVTSSDVRAIIVSPTRELAEQIATEARKVTSSTGLVVQCATGGTQKRIALQKMQYEGCHILVGTPGRLNDILSDPSTGIAAPNLGAFVLDEADRLLDDGFLPDIGRMQQQLPNRAQVDRQTLLFSATVPDELMSVIRTTMKPDFQFVRTVGRDETPTHEKVPQKIVECRAIQNQLAALYELSLRETQKANAGEGRPYKAIVYFSSTAEVSLAANIFNNLRDNDGGSEAAFGRNPLQPAQIMEIHSKLTQHERTRTADLFRRAKSAILFSSDVTARGMDFPDVTHVIQLGLPQTRDQYIHRLGRTARAHKTGEGWLILSAVEMKEYRGLLRDLPIKPDGSLAAATVNMTTPGQLPRSLAMVLSQLGEATKRVDRVFKVKAYAAALALYSRHSSSKQIIVDILNEWSRFGWGFPEPPKLSSSTVSKLGYSRCNGLNIDDSRRSYDRPLGSRGGFYGRGSSSGSGVGSGRFGGGGRPAYGSSGGGGGGSEPYVTGGRGYGQRREGGYDSQPRNDYGSRSSRNQYGSRPSRNDYGSPRRDDFNRETRELSP